MNEWTNERNEDSPDQPDSDANCRERVEERQVLRLRGRADVQAHGHQHHKHLWRSEPGLQGTDAHGGVPVR